MHLRTILFYTAISGMACQGFALAQHIPQASKENALDRYVARPDDAFQWRVVGRADDERFTTFAVELTSQRWRTPEDVKPNLWRHWLVVVRPAEVRNTTALLFIGGGRNGGEQPPSADQRLLQAALATGSVVAELRMIPNQPLQFNGDGKDRYEDDLIAYTWDQFLRTGDENWPARLPMVKSVVRAMDTVQALMGSDAGGSISVEQFVVAGGSKRGWTTWLTGAVDRRVAALIPIVIDVLNADRSMKHHYSAYGFWAPAIDDYVHHEIMHRRRQPRYHELMNLVDPFAYRDRFSMPKCIINATGDEFFLPDSSQFYFDDLPDEKHLCYVPNSNHSLRDTDAMDTLIAFHYAIAHNVPRPTLSWKYTDSAAIEVTADVPPRSVLLWQATNPDARDFRVETIGRAYTSSTVKGQDDRTYRARVSTPEQGWRAYFVQVEFDLDTPTPLRLTSPVRVVPDILPFADKEPPLID